MGIDIVGAVVWPLHQNFEIGGLDLVKGCERASGLEGRLHTVEWH